MYRILLVEDTPEEEAVLRAHLERYAAETGNEFKLTWQQSAFEVAGGELHFDLIFLDIQVPGINGMEAAQLLRDSDEETPIIFVTNLANYAVKGYEVNALDFIVKPIGYADFRLKMDKAMRVLGRKQGHSLLLPDGDATRRVATADIEFVDVRNHNLAYHLASGEVIAVRGTLSAAEEALAGAGFTRISNNCLANIAHIEMIRGNDLTMRSGETIYFSRSRRKPAMEAITRYVGGM